MLVSSFVGFPTLLSLFALVSLSSAAFGLRRSSQDADQEAGGSSQASAESDASSGTRREARREASRREAGNFRSSSPDNLGSQPCFRQLEHMPDLSEPAPRWGRVVVLRSEVDGGEIRVYEHAEEASVVGEGAADADKAASERCADEGAGASSAGDASVSGGRKRVGSGGVGGAGGAAESEGGSDGGPGPAKRQKREEGGKAVAVVEPVVHMRHRVVVLLGGRDADFGVEKEFHQLALKLQREKGEYFQVVMPVLPPARSNLMVGPRSVSDDAADLVAVVQYVMERRDPYKRHACFGGPAIYELVLVTEGAAAATALRFLTHEGQRAFFSPERRDTRERERSDTSRNVVSWLTSADVGAVRLLFHGMHSWRDAVEREMQLAAEARWAEVASTSSSSSSRCPADIGQGVCRELETLGGGMGDAEHAEHREDASGDAGGGSRGGCGGAGGGSAVVAEGAGISVGAGGAGSAARGDRNDKGKGKASVDDLRGSSSTAVAAVTAVAVADPSGSAGGGAGGGLRQRGTATSPLGAAVHAAVRQLWLGAGDPANFQRLFSRTSADDVCAVDVTPPRDDAWFRARLDPFSRAMGELVQEAVDLSDMPFPLRVGVLLPGARAPAGSALRAGEVENAQRFVRAVNQAAARGVARISFKGDRSSAGSDNVDHISSSTQQGSQQASQQGSVPGGSREGPEGQEGSHQGSQHGSQAGSGGPPNSGPQNLMALWSPSWDDHRPEWPDHWPPRVFGPQASQESHEALPVARLHRIASGETWVDRVHSLLIPRGSGDGNGGQDLEGAATDGDAFESSQVSTSEVRDGEVTVRHEGSFHQASQNGGVFISSSPLVFSFHFFGEVSDATPQSEAEKSKSSGG